MKSAAIVVACVAPYRSLRNQAHKLCSSLRSHSRSSRQQDTQRDSSVAQLQYIAPWMELWQIEQTETAANMGCEKCDMKESIQHQKDAYMTAKMPYLAPWVDADTMERGTRGCDTQVSPPALAHLEGHGAVQESTFTLWGRV